MGDINQKIVERHLTIKKPIHIAIVLGHWQNYGVETLNMNLYRNIDRSRVQFDFIVCETEDSDIPEEEIRSLGGKLYIVPSYSRLHSYIGALESIFRKERYLIAHCHMSTLNVFPIYAAKKAGVPVRIAHVHTMAGKGEHVKNAMKYALRQFSTLNVTDFATSSMMAGRWIYRGKISESQMYYLPVARNVADFRYDPEVRNRMRAELGLEGKFVIGHLGRFVPQKNHEFLVRLFKKVHDVASDALLLLAGDGPLVDQTLALAESQGVGGSVMYLGRRNDASALYQAMDVFVLPSLYEGVPGTGTEAQAAGLPFVFADTITEEAKVLPSAIRLPLSDMTAWRDAVLSTRGASRRDTIAEMTAAGYDIKTAAVEIADYYEGLAKKAAAAGSD